MKEIFWVVLHELDQWELFSDKPECVKKYGLAADGVYISRKVVNSLVSWTIYTSFDMEHETMNVQYNSDWFIGMEKSYQLYKREEKLKRILEV